MIKKNPFGNEESREKPKPKPKHHEEAPVPEPQPVEDFAMADSLVEALTENKKPDSKAYSIYLDTDIVATVDKIAKKSKSSRSKVINMMLRKLLDQ